MAALRCCTAQSNYNRAGVAVPSPMLPEMLAPDSVSQRVHATAIPCSSAKAATALAVQRNKQKVDRKHATAF